MTGAFDGRVVLITGANSGIGEASAVAFQEAGAEVFGVARREDALGAARSRHPKIRWLLADVTRSREITASLEGAVREAGRLDVVVNNAGAYMPAPLEQADENVVRTQFEVNVFGTTFVAKAALPALKASRGTIVNMSSAVGHKPAPGSSHYAATKAALESLTRSWALELAPHGIRVNAVAPGPVETPTFNKSGLAPERLAELKDALLQQVPLGRMASADEVARWVVAIADPRASWLTGEVLWFDGGMSLT